MKYFIAKARKGETKSVCYCQIRGRLLDVEITLQGGGRGAPVNAYCYLGDNPVKYMYQLTYISFDLIYLTLANQPQCLSVVSSPHCLVLVGSGNRFDCDLHR